jgi:hypothetical protein
MREFVRAWRTLWGIYREVRRQMPGTTFAERYPAMWKKAQRG